MADKVQMGLPLTLTDLRVVQGGRDLLHIPVLSLEAGQMLAIRGPSGAGKSTLLHALAGLLDGMQGHVDWGGTDLVPLTPEARAAFRRTHLGLIFQDHKLFEELNAVDNAAILETFVRDRTIRPRAEAMLGRLGITDLHRRVSSFSGGERQRIAVARAFAAAPPVILADEPTASLDRVNAESLIGDLVAMARQEGRTLIVVSHDPALIEAAGRVIELIDGRLSDG